VVGKAVFQAVEAAGLLAAGEQGFWPASAIRQSFCLLILQCYIPDAVALSMPLNNTHDYKFVAYSWYSVDGGGPGGLPASLVSMSLSVRGSPAITTLPLLRIS